MLSLTKATVVSAGLGEDASFDVELAARFGCRVIVVDPTPRAIAHFRNLEARVGEPSLEPYSANGRQSVRPYNLTSILPGQMQLERRAVAGTSGAVRFYAPRDPSDVSYSIVNFQNNYASDTEWIEVQAVSIADLLEGVGIAAPELLKLDIEGAEIEALPAMLFQGIRPRQILVEYDELNWPSRRSRRNFDQVHGALTSCGYVVTAFDRRSCVSYLRLLGASNDSTALGLESDL